MVKPRSTETALENRRRQLLAHVTERGTARIDELAEQFGVSLMTVHRDLDNLANRQLIRKLRGRVEAFPSLTVETATRFREQLNTEVKEALSAAAADEITEGMTLMLDDSSTLFTLARAVSHVPGLTVVTNSLHVARSFGRHGAEGTKIVFLGGHYQPEFDSCTGPDTEAHLRKLYADVAIVSATAISRGGLFHPLREYAELKKVMASHARRNLLLADSSKFGKSATFAYGDARDYDLLVTDSAAPEHEVEAIGELGVAVRCVPIA